MAHTQDQKVAWRAANRAKMSPADLAEYHAKEAANKSRQRWRKRFREVYGRPPTTEADHRIVRKMIRHHPLTCICFDCAWDTGEDPYMPRVARTAVRPT